MSHNNGHSVILNVCYKKSREPKGVITLNRLYEADQARPSHSVRFVKNHIEYLPLVKAMARVIGMERQMGFDGSSRVDALDLADLHTTRSVISTSLKIKRDYEAAFQAWKRDVNSRIQTLVSHQREIQHKRRKTTAASAHSDPE